MKYLIYLSTAVNLFSQDELEKLLEKSRKNNAAKDVTGLLLYHDGSFIQVLEGEPGTVDNVFKTIETDPRHKHIITIAEGEHDGRAFSKWSMGFHRASAKEMAELEAYTDPKKVKDLLPGEDHPAFTMLKTFATTNL